MAHGHDGQHVTVNDITRAEIAPPVITGRALDEQKLVFDHEHRLAIMKMGALGRLLGDRDEKPGTISFIVICLSFFLLGVVYFFSKDFSAYKDLMSFLTNAITLALGYLFGKSGGAK